MSYELCRVRLRYKHLFWIFPGSDSVVNPTEKCLMRRYNHEHNRSNLSLSLSLYIYMRVIGMCLYADLNM